ncbi:GrpB family protein [Devosia sp.]|uniref:GrpB family protein n=1 Tax=Devosia sp. TaxID=1871048 RepID=UPI003A95A514
MSDEPIVLHDADGAWPMDFARERELIAPLFPIAPRLIEHMGSTAIPGLRAKPVIDIVVLMDALDDARPAIAGLEASGYSWWRDNPDTSKLYLVKGLPPAPRRTHHLHIYADADEVRRHLVFRDYLRTHADARDAYQRLKEELAERYRDDRAAYSTLKTGFVDEIVALAGGPARAGTDRHRDAHVQQAGNHSAAPIVATSGA